MARKRLTAKEEERILLREIHLRNMIAKFQDMNLAERKIAAIPEVGIFWVDLDTGKVYSESTSLRDAEGYGNFKIYDGSHYESWKKVVSQNPKWRGMEYEDIPRGRVVYKMDAKKPEFIVFMARELNDAKTKRAITSRFNLPSSQTRFDFTDEHYEL